MNSQREFKMEMENVLMRNCFFCGSQEQHSSLLSVNNQVWRTYKNTQDIDFLDTVLTALDIDGITEMKNTFSAEGFCLCCMDQLLSLCEVSLQVQQLMESLKQIRIRCKEILADSIAHNNDPKRNDTRKQIISVLGHGGNSLKECESNGLQGFQNSAASAACYTDVVCPSQSIEGNDDYQDNYEQMFTPEVDMLVGNEISNNCSSNSTPAPIPTSRVKVKGRLPKLRKTIVKTKVEPTDTVDDLNCDEKDDNYEPSVSDDDDVPIYRPRKKKTLARTPEEVQGRIQNGIDEAAALGFEIKNCSVSVPKIKASSLISSLSESQTRCPFPRCQKVFEASELLHCHLLKYHRFHGRMKCTICSKEFRKKSTYIDHQNKHNNVRPYSCDLCEKSFYDRNHLADHKRRLHAQKTPQIVCLICTKTFREKEAYERHFRRFHSTDPISCEHCEEQFLGYKEYLNHLRIHKDLLEKPMFFCEVCDKVYTSIVSFKAHKRMHTGDQVLECSQCDYKTARKTHMTVHLATHATPNDKLQCEKCSRTYKYAVTLRRHQQFDCGKEGSDSLKCSFCGKGFKSRNNLLSHENNIHKVVGRPWLCPLCGKTFKIKKILQIHTKRSHGSAQQDMDSTEPGTKSKKRKISQPSNPQSSIYSVLPTEVLACPTGDVKFLESEPSYQCL